MFRSTYRIFVVYLIVAFAVSGVFRAANAGQPCAPNVHVSATSHTEHASHQHSQFRILGKRYPPESLEEAFAEGIVVGHAEMPEFKFWPGDIGALIAYLKFVQQP